MLTAIIDGESYDIAEIFGCPAPEDHGAALVAMMDACCQACLGDALHGCWWCAGTGWGAEYLCRVAIESMMHDSIRLSPEERLLRALAEHEGHSPELICRAALEVACGLPEKSA